MKKDVNIKLAVMTFRFRASWVHSLKEKRMIIKSLIAKLQNKYHASVAETGEQDVHQILEVSVAFIVPDTVMADSMMDDIAAFAESAIEAELIFETREIR